MNSKPKHAFETEHGIMGIEYECRSYLFLKPSAEVVRGRAVIFQKNDNGGSEMSLLRALTHRDGNLVFVNIEDFDKFINDNSIEEPKSSE